jgi:5-methylcytosine-specific restriction endonuclease McrA
VKIQGLGFTTRSRAERHVARGIARWAVPGTEIAILSEKNQFGAPQRPEFSANPEPFSPSFLAQRDPMEQAKRRRLMAAAPGGHSEREWREIVARYGGRCLRCGVAGSVVTLSKDHVTPLSVGGTNYASNLQPLCIPCNSWKGNREIDFRGKHAYATPEQIAQ